MMLESSLTALPKALVNSFPHDEIWTPQSALKPLLPYLNSKAILWEVAPGSGHLVSMLQAEGYDVVAQNRDFFEWEPESWDVIVSNPPYSKAAKFVRRSNELGKPWAYLLPITKLGAANFRKSAGEELEIIFLPKRIDFTNKKSPWFYVVWITHGLNIGKPFTYIW